MGVGGFRGVVLVFCVVEVEMALVVVLVVLVVVFLYDSYLKQNECGIGGLAIRIVVWL